jgi:hypothetical protein
LPIVAGHAYAADWVEVGADTEARYYVDVASIEVEGDTVRVQKKGIYTQPLTENFRRQAAHSSRDARRGGARLVRAASIA